MVGKMLFLAYAAMSVLCLFIFAAETNNGKIHVPSREIFTLSVLGGSFGTLFGMLLYSRKWRRPLFRYGIPMLIVVHSMVLFLAMR